MAHRRGLSGRMLALALAMVMILTSLPQTAMTAYAAEEGVEAVGAGSVSGAAGEASDEDVSEGASENELGGGV